MEIRNMLNYVRLPDRVVRGLSNTVPDKSLTVTEIMARFVVGQPATTISTYFDYEYDDERGMRDDGLSGEEYDTMRDYDLTEMEELHKQHVDNYNALSAARRKFKDKLSQENADKEYFSRLNKEGYVKKDLSKEPPADV